MERYCHGANQQGGSPRTETRGQRDVPHSGRKKCERPVCSRFPLSSPVSFILSPFSSQAAIFATLTQDPSDHAFVLTQNTCTHILCR